MVLRGIRHKKCFKDPAQPLAQTAALFPLSRNPLSRPPLPPPSPPAIIQKDADTEGFLAPLTLHCRFAIPHPLCLIYGIRYPPM